MTPSKLKEGGYEETNNADRVVAARPRGMTFPLLVLGALSTFGGLLILNDWIVDWLEPVVGPREEPELALSPLAMSGITVVVVLIGVAIAYALIARERIAVVAP